MPVNVSIVPCPDYSSENVRRALSAALEPLGGLDWVEPGMTVAIKTNLVSRMKPESAAVTHPALLAALAIVLVALIHFPLVPAAPFLEYDPADIPIFIGTFLFGPAAGLALTAVVCVIQGVTVSAASGPIGIIMHFLATGTFVLLAGNLYRAHRTRKAALLGLAAGTLAMTAVMCVCNLVFTPLFMGSPVGEVVKLLLPAIIPFNLAKAAINSVITYLVYKPISRLVFGEKEPAAS